MNEYAVRRGLDAWKWYRSAGSMCAAAAIDAAAQADGWTWDEDGVTDFDQVEIVEIVNDATNELVLTRDMDGWRDAVGNRVADPLAYLLSLEPTAPPLAPEPDLDRLRMVEVAALALLIQHDQPHGFRESVWFEQFFENLRTALGVQKPAG